MTRGAGLTCSKPASTVGSGKEADTESSCRQDLISASRAGASSATITPASTDDMESPFTLETVHASALKMLEKMGCLSPTDYQRVAGANCLQDILDSVDDVVSKYQGSFQSRKSHESCKSALGKFESAIDMLAQSMPQAFGLRLVGIIWGVLKVFLIMSQPDCATVLTP